MAGIEQVLAQVVDKLLAQNARIEALEKLNTALGNKVLAMAAELERCVEHVEIDRIETEKKARSKAKRAAKKAAAEVPTVQASEPVQAPHEMAAPSEAVGVTATDIFCVEEQVAFGITDPQDIADAIGETVEKVNAVLAMSEEQRRQIAGGE